MLLLLLRACIAGRDRPVNGTIVSVGCCTGTHAVLHAAVARRSSCAEGAGRYSETLPPCCASGAVSPAHALLQMLHAPCAPKLQGMQMCPALETTKSCPRLHVPISPFCRRLSTILNYALLCAFFQWNGFRHADWTGLQAGPITAASSATMLQTQEQESLWPLSMTSVTLRARRLRACNNPSHECSSAPQHAVSTRALCP
jgi:hypothetical protein